MATCDYCEEQYQYDLDLWDRKLCWMRDRIGECRGNIALQLEVYYAELFLWRPRRENICCPDCYFTALEEAEIQGQGCGYEVGSSQFDLA